jgi:hypothetical protein
LDLQDALRVVGDTTAGPMVAGAGFIGVDAASVERLERGENPAGWLARMTLLSTARRLAADLLELTDSVHRSRASR